MVMSSAYPVRLMCGLVGVGMSAMYRLKRAGARTEPCRTPFLRFLVLLDLSSESTLKHRFEMISVMT